MDTFFPAILLAYLEPFRQAFASPSFETFKAYVWAMMVINGSKCMTKIAESCFFLGKHLSSFERFLSENRWDLNQVLQLLLQQILTGLAQTALVHGAYLLGLDTTLLAKTSKRMPGVQKWHDGSGNADRQSWIIGHHWAIGGLLSSRKNRWFFWPILMRLISGKKNPSHWIASEEGLRPMSFWDATVALVLQVKSFMKEAKMRVVADAYFSKAPFIQALMKAGINLISRLRKDAVGWDDPPPYSGKGRPRKRGEKWTLADLLVACAPSLVTVEIYGKVHHLSVVVRDLFLRDVAEKVRVVVIKGKAGPIILFSTDLTLSAKQIIEIYAARFTLEIGIRDLKQYFGLADYQCYKFQSILRFVHLSCLSFCLWRLILLESDSLSWFSSNDSSVSVVESAFSFRRLRRHIRRFVLKQLIFSKSACDADFEKVESHYEELFRIAA
jgi:hypothetical protein